MSDTKDADKKNAALMEKIVSLCKRRGFVFPSAEIYGGLNGCWDYGPMGAELKRNLKDFWWRRYVHGREDIVGLDGAIITHQDVLKASGHVGGFSDPMCDDLLTRERLRADRIAPQSGTALWFAGAAHEESGFAIEKEYAVLIRANEDENKARKSARQYYAQFLKDGRVSPKQIELRGERAEKVEDSIRFNPATGSLLTAAREFNLMFQTTVGASADENDPRAIAYLRPETAQSIFVQFKNILETSRVKLPFGIAQIGKAFRNEINPRNFTFRSREFEQMEIEYFCRPEDGLRLTDEWLEDRLDFYEQIGIPRARLHILDVPEGDRAHYSKKTYDIEYEFPFGIQELEGIAYRTDYDLSRHQEHSRKPLEYFDEETREKLIPHVVEPSAGCDRTVLALICEAYDEETVTDEKGKEETRTVLRFAPRMAPIKAGIFPLLRNKPELVAKAREVQRLLSPLMPVFYDEGGAIGRRYRRQDEVGTPYGITIDFETLGEGDKGAKTQDTVTLRERDSMAQERIAIEDLPAYLLEKIR